MLDLILDLYDIIKYKILRISPKPFSIPHSIELNAQYDSENKVFWVESSEYPDFVASAESKEDLLYEVFETILLYFDVPRYFAKKMKEPGELVLSNGQKIVAEDIIHLSYA